MGEVMGVGPLTLLTFLACLLSLFTGLVLLFLGGQCLLSMYGLIDVPPPAWIGWFVDDLFHMGISARSSQAVVWAMVILGSSLIITGVDYLYLKYFKP